MGRWSVDQHEHRHVATHAVALAGDPQLIVIIDSGVDSLR
jgi:hypothetical protein